MGDRTDSSSMYQSLIIFEIQWYVVVIVVVVVAVEFP
jgi:hypothetical protein